MNKKYITFGLLGLFAMALVSAGLISYYGSVEQEISIESPITITELSPMILSGILQSPQSGGEIVVENLADFDVDVKVESIAKEGEVETTDITTSYVGTLELTKKTVDFDSDNWDIIDGKVQIEYTVVGEEFNAEVIEGEIPGYELVYYADNDDRFANPGETVLVGNVVGNLPATGDFNIVNNYSAEYPTTPFGAKIWYVPTASVGVVDWSDAGSFYFETSLIQYNEEGLITVYPGEELDFTPLYEFGAIEGTYTVNTTVSPVIA